MNIVQAFRSDPARILDRLVDGELKPTDRQTLLAALDDEPAGWRQCALAFLESQSWRSELSRVVAEPAPVAACAAAAAFMSPDCGGHDCISSSTDAKPLSRWGSLLAIAAGLLVAFWLGMQTSQLRSGDVLPEAGTLAQVSDSADTAPALSEEDRQDMLTFSLRGEDDRVETYRVPIVDAPVDDMSWLESSASVLPAELLDQFRSLGLEVASQVQWVPIELTDGRHVVLPIEELEIRNRPQAVYY